MPLSDASPSSRTQSIHTFGDYSEFLRSAMADEESLQMGESLQALAVHIEALVGMLQPSQVVLPVTLAQTLLALVDDLRRHRALLQGLGVDWHRFYEFDAHIATLGQFRARVTQWALDAAPPRYFAPSLADFDLAAWRVLGAGALLLDVYERHRSELAQRVDPVVTSVWARLLGWWRG